MKFGIVVSRYNQNITEKLLRGALKTFKNHGYGQKSVQTVWVPGAFEIPFMALKMAKTRKFAGIIGLGCVLKGETDHNHYISEAVAHGIVQVSLQTGIPVMFGVLTPNNLKQALARSENNSANKGTEAAEALIEIVQLKV